MPKQEPWFKPRKNEDDDDELINWLGRHNDPPPPPQQSTSWGCTLVLGLVGAGPTIAAIIANWPLT